MTLKEEIDIDKIKKIYDKDNNREITPKHPEWERYKRLVLDTYHFHVKIKSKHQVIRKIRDELNQYFENPARENKPADTISVEIEKRLNRVREKKNTGRPKGLQQKTYEKNKEICDMYTFLYNYAIYVDKNGRTWRQYQHYKGRKTARDLPKGEIYHIIAEYYDLSADKIKDIINKPQK